jgi:hypothetical protein
MAGPMTTREIALLLTVMAGCAKKPCDLAGTWNTTAGQVTFDSDGSYAVAGGPSGDWQLQGDVLTLSDDTPDCAGVLGRYTLTFGGDCASAVLRRDQDACGGRAALLDGLVAVRGGGGSRVDMARPGPADMAVPRVPCLKPSCTSSGLGCRCQSTEGECLPSEIGKSTNTCNATRQEMTAGIKRARCCADPSFPAEGTACVCNNWRCENRTAGSYSCTCGTAPAYADQALFCIDTVCCDANDTSSTSIGGQCTCSATQTSCATGYVRVDDCSYDVCPPGLKAVTSCDNVVAD